MREDGAREPPLVARKRRERERLGAFNEAKRKMLFIGKVTV